MVAACGGKKAEGLAPATDWNAGSAATVGMVEMGTPGRGATGANPHGGMNMDMTGGGAAGGMGADRANPHAALGLDPNGQPMGQDSDPADPRGGMDTSGQPMAGQDMSKLGLPPPDPNRPIDPTHRIAGTIKVDAKIKDALKRGTAVFLIAKHLDASGAPSGPPVAVEKLTWDKDELPFELTDHDSMIAGTVLSGDVVVIAHYDTDGDAISKTSGDILGQVKVTIPADKVTLMLDNPIP